MAELTTDTTMLTANGTSDMQIGFNGVTLAREIDFGVDAAAAATNYELLGLPKGFVALAVGLTELEKCPSGTITLKSKSDSATLGAAVTVGGDALAATVATAANAFAAGDMLCFVPSVKMDTGRVRIVVTGILVNGDTRYSPELAAPWRKVGNTSRNVAEPDRLLGK